MMTLNIYCDIIMTVVNNLLVMTLNAVQILRAVYCQTEHLVFEPYFKP